MIYDLWLWNLNPILCLRSTSGEGWYANMHILLPLPSRKNKNKKKTSAGAAWGKMCLADQKYVNRKGCSSSSSSLFFSYFTLLHLGPPAAPCWHNVCVGAKNTKVQTERSSQHTHLWHMFEQVFPKLLLSAGYLRKRTASYPVVNTTSLFVWCRVRVQYINIYCMYTFIWLKWRIKYCCLGVSRCTQWSV